MDDVRKIAEGLSKYQRERVALMPDTCFWKWADGTRWTTKLALSDRGLIAFMPIRPTPLGLAVRAYLKDQEHG